MTAGESIVLVEGFDDRDFWKGLLLRLGCAEARNDPPAEHRQRAGFTYRTPPGGLLHVIPYKAAPGAPIGDELRALSRLKLKERAHKPLRRLVLSPDADRHPTMAAAQAGVRSIVTAACPEATETSDGDFAIDRGALLVSARFVHADAARNAEGKLPAGVPDQRALEQLACAAIAAAHPSRAAAVASWLAARPDPGGRVHKAHAWSYYAGWCTEHGTGDFYGSLWRDPAVGAELERLLRAQGAWRVIDALLHA
jgi:hypothetical protein